MNTIKYMCIALSCLLFSCGDEAPAPASGSSATGVIRVDNLPANPEGGSGHYTFFSLKNNEVVPVADSATTKWDIGFNSTTIITNGGASGMGAAAVQLYTGLFDNLKEAPATGYHQDTKSGYAISTGSGNGWYNYNSTTHIISAIPGRVLLVKTADNGYAKIEILSYYKGAPAAPTIDNISRYYTFRYQYQGDGTRTF